MSKTTKTAVTFRLPPNLRALREAHRAKIDIGGKARAASFIHYLKQGSFGVSIPGHGLLLIGKIENGKWVAQLCRKVGFKTFETTSVVSKPAANPKAAFLEAIPAWEATMEA